ncbi:unnamed protein product, partial [Iphiclides podalirius]
MSHIRGLLAHNDTDSIMNTFIMKYRVCRAIFARLPKWQIGVHRPKPSRRGGAFYACFVLESPSTATQVHHNSPIMIPSGHMLG